MAKWKGPCGTTDAVVIDSNRRVHIWVEVENEGECPVKVRFFKTKIEWVPFGVGLKFGGFLLPVINPFRELTKTVRKGDGNVPIDRDEVNRVTISCEEDDEEEYEGEEEDGKNRHECKFTYSI